MNETGAMSWMKEDQTKLDLLRTKELAGTLTEPEHAELAVLMTRVEAEEAAALAPEMARLRADVAEMANELNRIEGENEALARIMAQQQTLLADTRRFLDEFDRRRASILDGLARVASGPLPAA